MDPIYLLVDYSELIDWYIIQLHIVLTLPCGIPVVVLKAGNNLLPKSSAIVNNSLLYQLSDCNSVLNDKARTCAERRPLKMFIIKTVSI